MNTTATNYTVALAEDAQVPMNAEQIRAAFTRRVLTRETAVWREGLDDWTTLAALAAELALPKATAPPLARKPVAHPMAARPVSANTEAPLVYRPAKSRGIYIILALFLGLLGIHNFYAGRLGVGLAQLLIVALTGWMGLPLIVVFVWVVLEMFFVHETADGELA